MRTRRPALRQRVPQNLIARALASSCSPKMVSCFTPSTRGKNEIAPTDPSAQTGLNPS